MSISFYATDISHLKQIFEKNNINVQVANKLHNWHLKKKKLTKTIDGISVSAQEFISSNFNFDLPKIKTVHESSDKTVKFELALNDSCTIETVLIPFYNKYSICLSSQVGCAMNCSFCYTGTQGFKRNLTCDEIIGQYIIAWNWLHKNRPGEERVPNIVFMGQGEPLHNFKPIKQACEIFLSTYGFSIGSQKITVSTSGYLPGIKKWIDEMPGVNLALSLHSPFTEKRNELIPINNKYPLTEVLNYIDKIKLQKKQFITYEYLLIDNFNDLAKDAHRVGELLQGKRAYINLIPFNPFPGAKYKRPTNKTVNNFKLILDQYKIPTLIRTTKGDDVLAACGQLNTLARNSNSTK